MYKYGSYYVKPLEGAEAFRVHCTEMRPGLEKGDDDRLAQSLARRSIFFSLKARVVGYFKVQSSKFNVQMFKVQG